MFDISKKMIDDIEDDIKTLLKSINDRTGVDTKMQG
jgi:hypothetical protein